MELWLAVLMVVGMITPMVYCVMLLRERICMICFVMVLFFGLIKISTLLGYRRRKEL